MAKSRGSAIRVVIGLMWLTDPSGADGGRRPPSLGSCDRRVRFFGAILIYYANVAALSLVAAHLRQGAGCSLQLCVTSTNDANNLRTDFYLAGLPFSVCYGHTHWSFMSTFPGGAEQSVCRSDSPVPPE